MYLWTADQIRQALEKCERECEEMVLMRHASVEELQAKRRNAMTLRRWLEKAEENERR